MECNDRGRREHQRDRDVVEAFTLLDRHEQVGVEGATIVVGERDGPVPRSTTDRHPQRILSRHPTLPRPGLVDGDDLERVDHAPMLGAVLLVVGLARDTKLVGETPGLLGAHPDRTSPAPTSRDGTDGPGRERGHGTDGGEEREHRLTERRGEQAGAGGGDPRADKSDERWGPMFDEWVGHVEVGQPHGGRGSRSSSDDPTPRVTICSDDAPTVLPTVDPCGTDGPFVCGADVDPARSDQQRLAWRHGLRRLTRLAVDPHGHASGELDEHHRAGVVDVEDPVVQFDRGVVEADVGRHGAADRVPSGRQWPPRCAGRSRHHRQLHDCSAERCARPRTDRRAGRLGGRTGRDRRADAKGAVDEPARARLDGSVDAHRPGDRAERDCQIGDRVGRAARSETRSAAVDGDLACGHRLGGCGRSRAHTPQWGPWFLGGNHWRGRRENGP